MKENKYDDTAFFDKYSQVERSRKGLEGAVGCKGKNGFIGNQVLLHAS